VVFFRHIGRWGGSICKAGTDCLGSFDIDVPDCRIPRRPVSALAEIALCAGKKTAIKARMEKISRQMMGGMGRD